MFLEKVDTVYPNRVTMFSERGTNPRPNRENIMLYIISDERYGRDDSATWTLKEFRTYVHDCFGDRVELTENADGEMVDEAGTVVLTPAS